MSTSQCVEPDQYTERLMPGAATRSRRSRSWPHRPRSTSFPRLRRALGGGPRILIKRDDAIGFAFGGNKVRKMALVAAAALARRRRHADHLRRPCSRITPASPPSPRRSWACAASWCSMRTTSCRPAADRQRCSSTRWPAPRSATCGRATSALPAMAPRPTTCGDAADVRAIIPLGASTPLGAAGFVSAVDELRSRSSRPTPSSTPRRRAARRRGWSPAACWPACRHASSASAPTIRPRRLSGDRPWLLAGLAPLLGSTRSRFDDAHVEVDDTFVGDGYGVPTDGVARSARARGAARGLRSSITPTPRKRWPG